MTAQHYKVGLVELKSASRAGHVIIPRQIAMYLCRHLTLRSTTEIGRQLGGRDHSTVVHAIEKIGRMMCPEWESDIMEIKGLVVTEEYRLLREQHDTLQAEADKFRRQLQMIRAAAATWQNAAMAVGAMGKV